MPCTTDGRPKGRCVTIRHRRSSSSAGRSRPAGALSQEKLPRSASSSITRPTFISFPAAQSGSFSPGGSSSSRNRAACEDSSSSLPSRAIMRARLPLRSASHRCHSLTASASRGTSAGGAGRRERICGAVHGSLPSSYQKPVWRISGVALSDRRNLQRRATEVNIHQNKKRSFKKISFLSVNQSLHLILNRLFMFSICSL